jgi:hypothetical protein
MRESTGCGASGLHSHAAQGNKKKYIVRRGIGIWSSGHLVIWSSGSHAPHGNPIVPASQAVKNKASPPRHAMKENTGCGASRLHSPGVFAYLRRMGTRKNEKNAES